MRCAEKFDLESLQSFDVKPGNVHSINRTHYIHGVSKNCASVIF